MFFINSLHIQKIIFEHTHGTRNLRAMSNQLVSLEVLVKCQLSYHLTYIELASLKQCNVIFSWYPTYGLVSVMNSVE